MTLYYLQAIIEQTQYLTFAGHKVGLLEKQCM